MSNCNSFNPSLSISYSVWISLQILSFYLSIILSSSVKTLHENLTVPIFCKIRVFPDVEKTIQVREIQPLNNCLYISCCLFLPSFLRSFIHSFVDFLLPFFLFFTVCKDVGTSWLPAINRSWKVGSHSYYQLSTIN